MSSKFKRYLDTSRGADPGPGLNILRWFKTTQVVLHMTMGDAKRVAESVSKTRVEVGF